MLSEVKVGNSISKSVFPPMMFSDRGDPWAGASDKTAQAGLGRVDMAGIADGLIGDTLVATEHGWTAVRDLRAGDMVLTFDNGLRPVRSVQSAVLWTAERHAPKGSWPLSIPAHALGNRTDMLLMPQQEILLESDHAVALFGDAFMLVSAAALDGHKGITRTPPQREMTLFTLVFDEDEVVYANGTVLVHCAGAQAATVSADAFDGVQTPAYRRLTEAQGHSFVQGLAGNA